MAAEGKIHVGDIGTDIQILVNNTDVDGVNQIQDLTGITLARIFVYDPQGNLEITLTASILNPPGTDGIIRAINTSAATFDEEGPWEFKGEITLAGGNLFTTNRILKEVLD